MNYDVNDVFEVKYKDLLARIGRLKTRHGIIETPVLLPVINPLSQIITPSDLYFKFKVKGIITNAYLVRKHFKEQAIIKGIHELLGFQGVIMTDSGAYQILKYGSIDVDPKDIILFQEDIGSDIGVILDIPTGWKADRKHAEYTVLETIKRANNAIELMRRNDMLWVGPLQGGKYIDLIEYSAVRMKELPFHIYALGSPTTVMEQYRYDILIDMIFAARRNIPPNRPLHLFGAGHPLMFAMAVALGCDIFDSASYALYAKNGRYITEYGTIRFERLNYLPCTCPTCDKTSIDELRRMDKKSREQKIAEHNLYMCINEINRIRQAIIDGRLWELLEVRCRSHPSLMKALIRFKKYLVYLERNTPISKKRGIFVFDTVSLNRPEIFRYRQWLINHYTPPIEKGILFLVPNNMRKPYHKSTVIRKIVKYISKTPNLNPARVHICIYNVSFGIIPLEIDDVYPVSQCETAMGITASNLKKNLVHQIVKFINKFKKNYEHYIILTSDILDEKCISFIEKECKVKVKTVNNYDDLLSIKL